MLQLKKKWPSQWDKFIEFVKNRKAISRDEWRMLPAFIEQHPTDFSKYDPDACWPSLLDDYVESLKKAEKKEKK